jgi:hypothetical protein
MRAVRVDIQAPLVGLGGDFTFLTPAAAEALAAFKEPPILNHRKEEVGRIRPAFALRA